jgi:tetratricopeptide (TPR) repeat protein
LDSRVIGSSAEYVPAQRTIWPVLLGPAPELADNFYPRPETGFNPASGPLPGEIVMLADADPAAAGDQDVTGGLGKTQIAAWLAHELVASRGVDLLIWINASSRDSVVTGYTQALADLGVGDGAESPDSAVRKLLEWLASASRPWLVVLDDLADYRDLEGLWPPGAARRVLVTTRTPALPGRQLGRVVQVGPFSRREAVNYLMAALKHDPDLGLGATDLAGDLDYLPMGLAFATAVMTDRRLDASAYRALFADRKRRLSGAWGGVCPLPVLVAWSLAMDRADQVIPDGMTWPIIALIALLDPAGIPAAVLMSQAACSYITGRPGAASAQVQAQVRNAVTVLDRLGLVDVDLASGPRTVRMHSVIQRATMSFLSADYRDAAGRAAAAAIAEAWPADDVHPVLAQALRDCTARLRESTGELLWAHGCHPLLLKAGDSLDNTGLATSAVGYWELIFGITSQKLGTSHPDTLLIRDNLASSYERAGQLADAIGLHERALTDLESRLGSSHADTLAARNKLAHAYLSAGRTQDAIALHKRTLADRERAQGPRDPDTLAARASLADCYRAAGQMKDAIPVYERTLSDRERAQGSRHLDTIAARASLAFAYRTAGLMKQAIPVYQRTLADREQVQGPHHPETMTARGNLAAAFHAARRLREAIPLYERTLADREQVHGPDHPDTITARGNLASAYHSARRLADAVPIYERTIADSEHVLGHAHPDTLTLRSNLAHAYHTAGRLTDAITLFRETLAEAERALGPDDPLTLTARQNLDAVMRE